MGLRAVVDNIDEEKELEFDDGDGGGGFFGSDIKVSIDICDNGYFLKITETADGVTESMKEIYPSYEELMARLSIILSPNAQSF